MIDWGPAVANTASGQNTFNSVTTTDAHYLKMDLPYASMFSNYAGSSVYSIGSTFSMRFSVAVQDVGAAGAGKLRVFPMIWKGSNFTTGAGEIPRADLTKLGTSAIAGQIYEELALCLASPTTGTIDVLYLAGGASWTTTTEIDPTEDKLLIGFAGDGADAVTNSNGAGSISWKAFIS